MRSRRSSRLSSMNSTKTITTAAVPSGPTTGPRTLCATAVTLVAGSTICTFRISSLSLEKAESGRVLFGAGALSEICLPSSWMVWVALLMALSGFVFLREAMRVAMLCW